MAASPEYRKAWREKNKDKIRERSSLYYEKNREAIIQRQREARTAYPDRHRTYDRRSDLRKKYGIELEEYEAMLAAQGGVCAICAATPNDRRLAVDHCHVTGKVRGLLCSSCNIGIGYFRDSAEALAAAIKYLSAPTTARNFT